MSTSRRRGSAPSGTGSGTGSTGSRSYSPSTSRSQNPGPQNYNPNGQRRGSAVGSTAPRPAAYTRPSRRRSFPWGKVIAIAAGVIVLIVIISALTNRNGSSTVQSPSRPSTVTPTQPPQITQPVQQPTSPDVTEPSKEGLIYTDDREPNYTAVDPQYETLHFEWDCHDNISTMQMDLPIDRQMYLYYRTLGRYQGVDNYYKYMDDPNNAYIIQEIVRVLKDVAEDLDFSQEGVVREVAKFVQDVIEYEYDTDTTGQAEFPRYPIETLYERQGDCEDTSILMAALLRELGYEVGFLDMPGHLAVALRTADDYSSGPYYEFNGHRYLYIESTGSGFLIGDIPDDCKELEATLHLLP